MSYCWADPAIHPMETARKHLTMPLLSFAGSDDTVVPEQAQSPAQQLKNARDICPKKSEGAYQSVAPLLSSSAE